MGLAAVAGLGNKLQLRAGISSSSSVKNNIQLYQLSSTIKQSRAAVLGWTFNENRHSSKPCSLTEISEPSVQSSTGIELIYATEDDKEVVKNLMQFYVYDFSEYVNCDVEENGLFSPYPDLDVYWKQTGDKFPYIIKKDGKYVGFALVKATKAEKEEFSIAEFFVMKKYRGQGIGNAVATQLFGLYKGMWEVHQRENNHPAQRFWIKVISNYTEGQFSDCVENGRRIQHFSSQ